MAKKWIVIVNRTEVRIFDALSMRRISRLSNSLGQEKNRAFTRSRPSTGRSRTGGRASTHNMTGEKNPHDQAAIQFVRKVNLYLKKRFNEHKFDELLVAAEPRMMGWLKLGMEEKIALCCEWKPKDLAKLSDHALKVLFLGKEAVWPPTALQKSGF